VERLDENIGALSVKLTPEDLRWIEDTVSRVEVQGERYPADFLKHSGR
jgi:aryl-alcohol dehydrogenase-like predicted oxidoreductase